MSHYTTPEIERTFSREATHVMWAQIEASVLFAQAATGLIPTEWAEAAKAQPLPEPFDYERAMLETGHEVVAFLHSWGLEHVHIGLTSSDLTDTALAIKVMVTNDLILEATEQTMDTLWTLVEAHLGTPRLARTHGQPAVPDTLGHRFEVLYGQIGRCTHLPRVPGKLSGPVGSYCTPAIDRVIEAAVLDALGLMCNCEDPEHQPECSQIVPRDFLSRWAWAVADLVGAFAAVGTEVRLLAHSGVREASEGRSGGYVGSSAMPHKRNPNQSERLTGLARMARSAALAISEGIEQWHDRDLAHSSVEREFVPMLAGLGHYSARLTNEILTNLQIDTERMGVNLMQDLEQAQTHHRMVALQLKGTPYRQAAIEALATTKEEQ
jgi:adenylosuccinate lyase